jgi:hypothetical protein
MLLIVHRGSLDLWDNPEWHNGEFLSVKWKAA